MTETLLDPLLFMAAALKLGFALLALLAVTQFTRWLDRRAGHHFTKQMEIIRASRLGLSLYLGFRWLGACLLVGQLLS